MCSDIVHPSGLVMEHWAKLLRGHMCYAKRKKRRQE
jgi:hypothetical protein